MDYLEIKANLDRHLQALYQRPGVLADPTRLATELVIIATIKMNLIEMVTDLQHLADSKKSEVYYKIMAAANVSRAKEECRLDKDYLLARKNADYVLAYLKEVSSVVSTVQTYLKWKGQEASF
jgi:hypothetical protein